MGMRNQRHCDRHLRLEDDWGKQRVFQCLDVLRETDPNENGHAAAAKITRLQLAGPHKAASIHVPFNHKIL